jgi:hypothetical protein
MTPAARADAAADGSAVPGGVTELPAHHFPLRSGGIFSQFTALLPSPLIRRRRAEPGTVR